MLPELGNIAEQVPVLTPYTWRGAPVWALRYTTTATIADGATIYTFKHTPHTIGPSTQVTYRLINILGWVGIHNERVWVGQQMDGTPSGDTPGGFHINSSGILRYKHSGTAAVIGAQLIFLYAVCRV